MDRASFTKLESTHLRIARRGLISTGATKAAGGLVSVGTNTVVGDLLNGIEGLFRREDDDLYVRSFLFANPTSNVFLLDLLHVDSPSVVKLQVPLQESAVQLQVELPREPLVIFSEKLKASSDEMTTCAC